MENYIFCNLASIINYIFKRYHKQYKVKFADEYIIQQT